ncbi:YpoC family protein [Anaerobacillus sp. MEB173]|uniref:YpoC family protein n=1 Tax=Anaerobacillus sp. MEB173 TaxID=3383345 RepID=UPI003F9310FF
MIHELAVPKELQSTPFYSEKSVIVFNENFSFEKNIQEQPFLYELLAQQKIEAYKPWADHEQSIEILFQNWTGAEQVLNDYYKVRDRKKARKPMIEQLSGLIQIIYWGNGLPVPILDDWQKKTDDLSIKPVNITERISFINDTPDHYHSFIQLSQLFAEFIKQYKVTISLEKNRKRIFE